MERIDPHTTYRVDVLKGDTIHNNTNQDVIMVTKDRLELRLRDFRESAANKYKAVSFGGIAITLLVAIVTSSTNDILGISAEVWSAIFIVAEILSLFLTICSGIIAFRTRKDRDLEEVCRKIMESENTTNSTF